MFRKIAVFAIAVACISLFAGCESSSDDGGSGGDLAGTWSGNACGRALTMTINQSGTSLSGSYHLSDPDFSESFSGTASSESAPATATLNGGGDRSFRLTFNSASSVSGGFLKSGSQVCSVSASK
jgi:hypothetical protein